MTQFILLTKDQCPQCDRLKQMLKVPLKGQYDDQIEVVHKETNLSRFQELVTQYNIKSVPVIIHQSGAVLTQTQGLSSVKSFLSQ